MINNPTIHVEQHIKWLEEHKFCRIQVDASLNGFITYYATKLSFYEWLDMKGDSVYYKELLEYLERYNASERYINDMKLDIKNQNLDFVDQYFIVTKYLKLLYCNFNKLENI